MVPFLAKEKTKGCQGSRSTPGAMDARGRPWVHTMNGGRPSIRRAKPLAGLDPMRKRSMIATRPGVTSATRLVYTATIKEEDR
jgi:hypothetical protein